MRTTAPPPRTRRHVLPPPPALSPDPRRNESGRSSLVQLTTPQRTYEGRILVGDDIRCWIAESDGQVYQLLLGTVSSFKKLPGEFRLDASPTSREAPSRVLREVGVRTGRQQVVCAGQKRAKPFAAILDSTSRAFAGYVSRRSFPVQKAEFPQATIVFPSFELFRTYAESEGSTRHRSCGATDNPGTNRVVLYEGTPVTGQAESVPNRTPPLTPVRSPAVFAGLLFHVKHSWVDGPEEVVGTPTGHGPIASFGAVAGAR